MAKRKLRPSQDVYHRVRWDPALDPADFELVYRDRSGAFVGVPLAEFVPGGRIPWSRIYRVRRRDGVVVWDREARRDLLFGSGDTPADERLGPSADQIPDDGFLVPLEPYRHGPRGWRPGATAPEVLPRRQLRVLSYNVLFDRFRAEGLRTAERRPAQLALLAASGADLIALQEVTPEFLEALLAEGWVQRDYWASAGPGSGAVVPNGQVLLSRWPPSMLGLHAYSGRKHVLVARFADGVGGLWVAVVHLTSNMTPRAPEVRTGQLAALRGFLERSAREATWLIAGDFNQAEGEPDGGLAAAGVVDLWPALRPDDPGATFDPETNALAAELSENAKPVRYDRALLYAPGDRWRARAIELFARQPLPDSDPPLYLSDHFGLSLELTPGDGSRGDPVHSTALAVIPPLGVWPSLQALRREADPRFTRWPPHVSVLYGFVPEPHLLAAAARVRRVLEGHAPFPLVLKAFGHFPHRRRASLWLRPEPSDALRRLQAALEAEFPACSEQSRKGEDGYTPHLTVAQVPHAETQARLSELAQGWSPQSFVVESLALIAREQGEGFDLVAAVPLGEPHPLAEAVTASGLLASGDPPGLSELRAASPLPLELFGSWSLGCALTTSDLDLGVVLGAEQDALGYYGVLTDALERAGRVRGMRVVPGEQPLLRLALALDEGRLQRVDVLATRGRAVQATVGEALQTAAGERWPAALGALRALRCWAHCRQLDSQAFGGLGGVAWATLAVDVALGDDADSELLVERCLATLAREGGHAVDDAARRLEIAGELTKGLTPSTEDLLRRESRRGQRLADAACTGAGAWSGLVFPAPQPGGRVVWVEADDTPRATGQILGLAQRLIRGLEETRVGVRPYPRRFDRGWAFAVDALGDAQRRAAARALSASDELALEFEG